MQVANIFAGFLTTLPFIGSQNCKHWRTIQLKNVEVLKIHNFDILERDYLPEEKDLRREENPRTITQPLCQTLFAAA